MITIAPNTGSRPSPTPSRPMLDDVFLMMAAAQMHSEGRLIKADDVPNTMDSQSVSNTIKPTTMT